MRVLGALVLVAAMADVAYAKPGRNPLHDLALTDRCALGTVVAKQVRDVEELTGSLPTRASRLNLFIAVFRRKESNYRSIIDAEERCPSTRIARNYIHGAPIDVSFAGGTAEDLNPDLHYILVRCKRASARRYTFTWKVGDTITGCLRDRRCSGPSQLLADSPTLTLRVINQGGRYRAFKARLDMPVHDDR